MECNKHRARWMFDEFNALRANRPAHGVLELLIGHESKHGSPEFRLRDSLVLLHSPYDQCQVMDLLVVGKGGEHLGEAGLKRGD